MLIYSIFPIVKEVSIHTVYNTGNWTNEALSRFHLSNTKNASQHYQPKYHAFNILRQRNKPQGNVYTTK